MMAFYERWRHCWLSDGRLMGFFATPTGDGELLKIKIVIRYPDKRPEVTRMKVIDARNININYKKPQRGLKSQK